jgi:hypothetical protein
MAREFSLRDVEVAGSNPVSPTKFHEKAGLAPAFLCPSPDDIGNLSDGVVEGKPSE